ncbi:hypothetical protein PHO31112_04932 [Pandoraea horticolens]|uniref:Uncharacterized protein n=1 Tax=Pandoraea horticolens TaxID=2508298 RepID=A0A5E4Z2G1_9BURK|nr:hypothetical protein PHO31112_04932 [Pandoraea horticolens]
MPNNGHIASSVDPIYAAVSYVPKWHILAYANRSGNKQLQVAYGNEDPDHPSPTLSQSVNDYPAMAVFNGVVHLAHQTFGTDHAVWHMTYANPGSGVRR